MKNLKTKTILKYAVLAYLAYLLCATPKTDWEKNIIVSYPGKNGQKETYVPKQSTYPEYAVAWWKQHTATIGITGIIDQYILAPIGVNLN